MTLLEEIQNSAVDVTGDLGTLLRKCKLLAARLGSKPLEDWLLWESNGYPENVSVPEYRIWQLELKGNFAGSFGAAINNAPIPLACLPEKAREEYQHYKCRNSVASIEALLGKGDEGTPHVSTGDLVLILGSKVYQGYNCIQVWAEFSPSHLIELLNTVRNRILDFVLAVWKEQPAAGEPASKIPTILDSTRVTQIFQTTVYGGSANLIGAANDSTITFNVTPRNFPSLERVLCENGLSELDVKELRAALELEKELTSTKGFGPKVSLWIAKMMQKAAEGSWGIGIGAAGTLLAQAITKYYGL